MTRHFPPPEGQDMVGRTWREGNPEYLLQFCAKCKFKFFPIVIVGVLFALRCKHSTPFPGHKTNDKLEHTLALVSFWGFPIATRFSPQSLPFCCYYFPVLFFPPNICIGERFLNISWSSFRCSVVVDRIATKCTEKFQFASKWIFIETK